MILSGKALVAPLTPLQPFDNLVVDAMDGRGEVLVNDDDIPIGSVADSCSVISSTSAPLGSGSV